MASIIASLALLRAVAIASLWLASRREMLDNPSKPTTNSVSRTIKASVITKANPRGRESITWAFMTNYGCEGMISKHFVITFLRMISKRAKQRPQLKFIDFTNFDPTRRNSRKFV